jgi:hypothetical protein
MFATLKDKASNIASTISDKSDKAKCQLGKHKFETSVIFTEFDQETQIGKSFKNLTGSEISGSYKFNVKCTLKCERCGFECPCNGQIVSVN